LHKTRESIPLDSEFVCLAPLSGSHRANRSKWIKLYILSCRLDGEIGHCLEPNGAEHTGIDANPATFPDQSTFQYTDLLPFLYLEMANFRGMVMTSKGTVLFTGGTGNFYLVDQNDLDAGRISAVMFTWNGGLEGAVRKRAYNMHGVYLDLVGLGRTPVDLSQDYRGETDVEGSDRWNRP
jgi:hypothetical protein